MAADKPSTGSAQVRPLRVLVDTNVVLDQLLQREPWYSEAQPFWHARDAGLIVAYLPVSVLTDIYYISRKQVGNAQAKAAVARCLGEFGLIAIYRETAEAALALPGNDFEDNVQIVCAQTAGLELIVTRNTADFAQSPVPAVEPAQVVSRLPGA